MVEVVFDWEAAPNADPEGMTVWFSRSQPEEEYGDLI